MSRSWECHRCHAVMAPTWPTCWYCKPTIKKEEISTKLTDEDFKTANDLVKNPPEPNEELKDFLSPTGKYAVNANKCRACDGGRLLGDNYHSIGNQSMRMHIECGCCNNTGIQPADVTL